MALLLFLVAFVALSRRWLVLGSLWNNLEFEMILKVENKKYFFDDISEIFTRYLRAVVGVVVLCRHCFVVAGCPMQWR